MIGFIKGNLFDTTEDIVCIDVGGVGYEIFVPSNVFDRLPMVGEEVLLYTYYQVKEDSATLFGFLTKKEKSIFSKLISVNGVGPKGAISILSSLTIEELVYAVAASDAKAFKKASGIGPKTAARICIDLKDKLGIEDTLIDEEIKTFSNNQTDDLSAIKADAYSYLENLGFTSKEIMSAFSKLKIDANTDTETIVSMALDIINQ